MREVELGSLMSSVRRYRRQIPAAIAAMRNETKEDSRLNRRASLLRRHGTSLCDVVCARLYTPVSFPLCDS